MKFIYYIVIIGLFSSCRSALDGYLKTTPEPYLRLKDGRVIKSHHDIEYNQYETRTGHIGKLETTTTLLKPHITCDDSNYRLRDIAYFRDGGPTYGNIAGKRFAVKFGDGRINTYVTINHKTIPFAPETNPMQTFSYINFFSTPGHKDLSTIRIKASKKGHLVEPNKHYFICQADTGRLCRFNCTNLKKMIPPENPAASYLHKYHSTRLISSLTAFAGTGLLIAGLNMTSSGPDQSASAQQRHTLGNVLSYSGIAVTGISLTIKYRNHKNLIRALNLYNVH